MSTAFERRAKRLREHVLNHSKQENESTGEERPLEDLKVEELKELAKEKGIKGSSNLKREELIEVLKEQEDEE
ncbi:Rho termination factor N-terminal domain-containing protein [Tissierella carlieri]|uniref:Rho termination factor N-terminal domain-containing protein n=1 Tax=Tissierella carlieri TaxID=689904 RepID=UPI001C104EB5|nr:Rho termination factor N-terminal domain-containing protein [Tissierella carlieri]MBU5311907.1 Rho termination factor N-terminal domain-containing protein [Tissierella carlieri]